MFACVIRISKVIVNAKLVELRQSYLCFLLLFFILQQLVVTTSKQYTGARTLGRATNQTQMLPPLHSTKRSMGATKQNHCHPGQLS